MSFRFESSNSNGKLTEGEGGTNATAPKTFQLDAAGMLLAMQGVVSAMNTTSRSFNPQLLAENVLKNVERKRKAGSAGGASKMQRSDQLPSTGRNPDPVAATLVPDVDHSTNSNNRTEKSSKSFKSRRYVRVKPTTLAL